MRASAPATTRPRVAWLLYDWANSAFQTTVVTVLAGPYLTALAQDAVGANGVVCDLEPVGVVTAKALFPYAVSLSVIGQVLLLPWLGAVADHRATRRPLMAAAGLVGVVAAFALSWVQGAQYLLGAVLFVVANMAFGATIVLYNSFLHDVATPAERDAVSSRGFALGYLGGGLLLALNLVLIVTRERWGLSQGEAVRLSMRSAAVWWGVFGAWSVWHLPQDAGMAARADAAGAPVRRWMRLGLHGLAGTWRALRALPHTRRFLYAYMTYNDGIQTVISIASVVLAQELFVARGVPVDDAFLMTLVLMIQFVAFGGALLCARLSARLGTARVLASTVGVWAGIVIYAWGWLQTTRDAQVMGVVLAVVLGGSQALSRSLYSRMIPRGQEAAFFGIYEVSERGTSWIGPLLFGVVVAHTNSYRAAILSLVVLFVGGLVLLAVTDTDQAERDAERLPHFPVSSALRGQG